MKIYKADYQLRPIISCINLPTEKPSLTKFMAKILDASFRLEDFNSFRVRDRFQFVCKTNNFQLPIDFVLTSFDVVFPFTNIPLNLIFSFITDNFNLISEHCSELRDKGMPLLLFLELISFLFNSICFWFNKQLFCQVTTCPRTILLAVPLLKSQDTPHQGFNWFWFSLYI